MDIKLKSSSNESLNITGGNVNVQTNVSVSGTISEGGTLLGSKYQSALTMANNNIQLTGSQLGLNGSLTGISTISGVSTISPSNGSQYFSMGSPGSISLKADNIQLSGGSNITLSGNNINGSVTNSINLSGSYTQIAGKSLYLIGLSGSVWGAYCNLGSSSATLGGYVSNTNVYIAAGSSYINLSGGSISAYNSYASGSVNLGSPTIKNPTYLWGSVINKNNGITLATSSSDSGCTLQYDSNDECVKFNFS